MTTTAPDQGVVSECDIKESPNYYGPNEEHLYGVDGVITPSQEAIVNSDHMDVYDASNSCYNSKQDPIQVQNGYQHWNDVVNYNYQSAAVVHVPKSVLQITYDEIDLLFTAGEITEAEAAELRQLALQGDTRVREAISQHSQGNSSLLVYLLHRENDHLDLLYQRDMQYASYIQQATQDCYTAAVQPPSLYTYTSLYATNQQPLQTTPFRYDTSSSTLNITNSAASSQPTGGSLPPLFYSDTFLCGLILKQTQTKLVFKKWKHCVFMLIPNALQLYQTIDDWRCNRAVYWSLPIYRCLVIILGLSKSVDDWAGEEQATRSNATLYYRYYRREQQYL